MLQKLISGGEDDYSVLVSSSLKFITEASHLNLWFFCDLNLFLLGIQPPFTFS